MGCLSWGFFNTLRPRQNGRHFPDDIFKCIFLNENEWISIKISLKLVPKFPINNIPALVQIMAWRRPGDKPLSEPMTVILLTDICVTRPQWVNQLRYKCTALYTFQDTYPKWSTTQKYWSESCSENTCSHLLSYCTYQFINELAARFTSSETALHSRWPTRSCGSHQMCHPTRK